MRLFQLNRSNCKCLYILHSDLGKVTSSAVPKTYLASSDLYAQTWVMADVQMVTSLNMTQHILLI